MEIFHVRHIKIFSCNMQCADRSHGADRFRLWCCKTYFWGRKTSPDLGVREWLTRHRFESLMELSKYLLKRGVMVCSCESCTLTNVFFCNCKQKIPGTSSLTLQVVVLQSVVRWKVRCFLSLVQSKRQTDTWKLSLLLKSSSPILDCLINQSVRSICTGENACPTEGNELNKGTKRWFIKIPP